MLERADGSAKWVQDGSAVLAAVHGPSQAGQRREDAERAVIQVLYKPRNGLPGARWCCACALSACSNQHSHKPAEAAEHTHALLLTSLLLKLCSCSLFPWSYPHIYRQRGV